MNIGVASENDQQRKFGNSTLTFTDVRGVVINSRLTNACEALKKQIRELNVVIDEQPFQESEKKLKWSISISNCQRDHDQDQKSKRDRLS